MRTFPPFSLFEDPTLIVISPPLPDVEAPVITLNSPDAPNVDVPVRTVKAPLTPSLPAPKVSIEIIPLVDLSLKPDVILIRPPVLSSTSDLEKG